VSQSSQVLALLGVFPDVGIHGGVPASLMAFALLFASSYFSVITPQGEQPERHLRRQRLSDAARVLSARIARDAVLPRRVPRGWNRVVGTAWLEPRGWNRVVGTAWILPITG